MCLLTKIETVTKIKKETLALLGPDPVTTIKCSTIEELGILLRSKIRAEKLHTLVDLID
jgi:hypothetical protein